MKWASITTKLLLIGLVWLTIIPLLIGISFESVIIMPWRIASNESPIYPFLHCWALGLVSLKVWTRCILLIDDNALRNNIERVINLGVERINLTFTFREIIFPVLFNTSDFILIPYFFSRLAGVYFDLPYEMKSKLVRLSFVMYLLFRLFVFSMKEIYSILKKKYNDIRDSRYLIGTELTNRSTIEINNSWTHSI